MYYLYIFIGCLYILILFYKINKQIININIKINSILESNDIIEERLINYKKKNNILFVRLNNINKKLKIK
jgi:hypothetical protein